MAFEGYSALRRHLADRRQSDLRTQSWSDWGQGQVMQGSLLSSSEAAGLWHHPPLDDASSHGKGLYQGQENRRNKWDFCFGGPPQHQSDARFYLQVPGLFSFPRVPPNVFFPHFWGFLMCGMYHIFPPIVIKKKWLSGSNAVDCLKHNFSYSGA